MIFWYFDDKLRVSDGLCIVACLIKLKFISDCGALPTRKIKYLPKERKVAGVNPQANASPLKIE